MWDMLAAKIYLIFQDWMMGYEYELWNMRWFSINEYNILNINININIQYT